jgi:hypothetical protein
MVHRAGHEMSPGVAGVLRQEPAENIGRLIEACQVEQRNRQRQTKIRIARLQRHRALQVRGGLIAVASLGEANTEKMERIGPLRLLRQHGAAQTGGFTGLSGGEGCACALAQVVDVSARCHVGPTLCRRTRLKCAALMGQLTNNGSLSRGPSPDDRNRTDPTGHMDKQPYFLAQNRRLSAQDCRRALAALDSIQPGLAGREDYVGAHGLDPGFSLPDANWASSGGALGQLVSYAKHLRQDPRNFDLLRFNVRVFTGFDPYFFAAFNELTPETWATRPQFILWPPPADADARLLGRLNAVNHPEIWQYFTQKTTPDMVVSPPPICGEVGWLIDGVIVNHDTAVYQERITLLEKLGLFRFLAARAAQNGRARVLEIGGGYGALAHYIKKLVPNAAYTICDLPESLSMSASYLALTRPELRTHVVSLEAPQVDDLDAFHFVPNYVLPQVAHSIRFDLVINTLSLSEMSVAQIDRYGMLISEMISGTGLFFEQNQDNLPIGLQNCKLHLPRHFLMRTKIDPPPFALSQGSVDIWTNHRVKIPYPNH